MWAAYITSHTSYPYKSKWTTVLMVVNSVTASAVPSHPGTLLLPRWNGTPPPLSSLARPFLPSSNLSVYCTSFCLFCLSSVDVVNGIFVAIVRTLGFCFVNLTIAFKDMEALFRTPLTFLPFVSPLALKDLFLLQYRVIFTLSFPVLK